jgi:L-tyrosine isonitrile synthase
MRMGGFWMSNSKTVANALIATSPFSSEPTFNDRALDCGGRDRFESGGVGLCDGLTKEKPHRNPSKKIAPENILSSFNVRTFRREQPSDTPLMLETISKAIASNEPVPFVMYWGKGPRAAVAEPDTDCLDFLKSLVDRIGEVYPHGATMKLIFTDSHAALNGHADADIRSYFAEIDHCARVRGFDTCRLGDLTRVAAAEAKPVESEMPEDIAVRLTASASKWYRGGGTVGQGALKYFQMNMVERHVVGLAFPRSIMITFNASALRILLPMNLPIFYMYSLRRGLSVKPWFIFPPPAL